MKKIIATILSLVMVLSLSVCAYADNDSFDPTLTVEKAEDGKTITVTMNDLPDGVSAELTIPCDGWDGATVKDSAGKTVTSTFDKTADAVTFAAVGGTYIITKSSAPSYGYPIVTPEETPVEKPNETKPTTPATPPVTEETVTPAPEDTTPAVPDEPVVDEPAVDTPPADDDAQGGDSAAAPSVGLWIGILFVVLVAAIVVVAILIKRKKA